MKPLEILNYYYHRDVDMPSMIHSFFHPEDAYIEAQKPVNEAWDKTQSLEQPFMQHGQDQYSDLNAGRQALMNPTQMQDEWAKHYQTSPQARQMIEQSRGQGLDAASSMGLMGSSGAVSNIQNNAARISTADRHQYMQDLMNKYLAGIGIGQNLYNIGSNQASNLGNQSMQHGNTLAGLKYGENAAPGQLFGNIMGTVSTLAGDALAI
jgi:hypothetical protein